MTSSILIRLEGWREVAIHGKPAWLAEVAPSIILKLEAEIAAAAIEARSDATVKQGAAEGESAGPKDDAHD